MEKESIILHIENRKKELADLSDLWIRLASLHNSIGLSDKAYSEIRTKISSRIAFLEKSIIDHEKRL